MRRKLDLSPQKRREHDLGLARERNRRYRLKHPNRDHEYYLRNKERIIERTAAWSKKNHSKVRDNHKSWRANNIQHVRRYRSQLTKRLLRENHNFVIRKNLRTRMYRALRGIVKAGRLYELLGCSINDFKIYIESKFDIGMSWENYGKVWEIDHIIPCSIFDLTKPDHQKRCFHFSNQQPLLVSDNRRKHAKVLTNQYMLL